MYKDIPISVRRITLSLILLIFGTSIYLFFRQDVVFLSWISKDVLDFLKNDIPKIDNSDSLLVYFMLYCLPDALWYAALLTIQIPFYKYGAVNRFLTLVGILLPFVLEVLQYLMIIRGTFDLLDILTYLSTLIIITLCDRKCLLSKQD